MKKRLSLGLVVFLIVLNSSVLAQDEATEEKSLWDEIKEFLGGSGVEEKALVGKAGGIN